MNTSFNLEEAKSLMHYVIDTNRRNAKMGINSRISAEIIGDSGLGKTSAVLQVAEELEMDFVKLNMAQIEEVGDLCGYPIKEFCITHPEKGEKWVPTESLMPFYKHGWMPTEKKPRMSYAIPEWISGRKESGILLLDDYSRGDIRLLQATMELIDRGQYISWKLPEDWHIILTSNPDDGEFHVNTLDRAQKGRYLSAKIRYDAKVWAKWAEMNQVDQRCINFMLMNEDVVRTEKFAMTSSGEHKEVADEKLIGSDPRSWTKFFYAIGHLEDFKKSEALERIEQIGTMAVGSDLAVAFATFINGDMDKIPEIEQVVFSKNFKNTISELKTIVRPEGRYRADIANIIGIRIVNYMSAIFSKRKKYPKGCNKELMLENFKEILKSEALGVDMSFAIAKSLIERHQQIVAPIFGDASVRKYLLS